MKTTLNFDDRLIRAAKKHAVDAGETLTRVIEQALGEYLETAPRPSRPYRAKLVVKHGRPRSGVDLDSRDQLHERMDGRA